ncbi:hypothetical protein EES41_35755 [Streptomyces sp. ADI95-16]|nr:hypothetical protein EES41_35755 [Streptomyces sp. ADI95-16]
MGKVAGRFARVEPRRRARAFVLGLLADLPRKNCWTIAEHAGDASPAGMQHFLSRARWDADEVRDDIRDFVVEHLGDEDAVLVVDETGDLKKGTASVGVQMRSDDCSQPCLRRPATLLTACAGLHGAACTKHARAPATTSDKPPNNHEDHVLQPEY